MIRNRTKKISNFYTTDFKSSAIIEKKAMFKPTYVYIYNKIM